MPDNTSFPIMERFYTIQGEGYHTGKAAYFIRIAGCDVGCVWCDVKDSWHTKGYPDLTVKQLVDEACNHAADIVVITGGEPAMYDLTDLCDALHAKNKQVHIETSGAYALNGDFDWVCFSPKKFKAPVQDFALLADEIKVVVFNKSDFAWGESFVAELKPACKRYLQPEWEKHEKVQPLIIDYVKNNPHWQISLQTHKYLGVD